MDYTNGSQIYLVVRSFYHLRINWCFPAGGLSEASSTRDLEKGWTLAGTMRLSPLPYLPKRETTVITSLGIHTAATLSNISSHQRAASIEFQAEQDQSALTSFQGQVFP